MEGRVGLVPEACAELVKAGRRVCLETGAGDASGFSDEAYRALGVDIVADAATVYGENELIVKVKEPVGGELGLLREGHLLFSYLHLAANEELTRSLLETGLTAVAFETVQEGERLPLLAPMSDIAGRLAIQIGTTLLHRPQGGKGLLQGGLPAAERGRVVVLGAGNAGGNAARMAAALGAQVVVFDKKPAALERMRALGENVTALYPYTAEVTREVARADLVVGAVLIPGASAPRVLDAGQVAAMAEGGVVVDIAVDQGGCIETTRSTTYAAPTYRVDGVTHFCVTNMPGAVPRSAPQALSASLIPYVLELAGADWRAHPALRAGINVERGRVVHPGLGGEDL
ncbi:MAG: alanine dehydrogenase [Candidatus Sedimenticola endophacoides]